VLTAGDGNEAQRILSERRHEIDLVVTDLVMPGAGGIELLDSTTGWTSRPRFLFSSGYADPERGDGTGALRSHPFLPKPWGIQEFAAAVRSALDS
jgi:DNA-binding NarL/FixJ family response regulator